MYKIDHSIIVDLLRQRMRNYTGIFFALTVLQRAFVSFLMILSLLSQSGCKSSFPTTVDEQGHQKKKNKNQLPLMISVSSNFNKDSMKYFINQYLKDANYQILSDEEYRDKTREAHREWENNFRLNGKSMKSESDMKQMINNMPHTVQTIIVKFSFAENSEMIKSVKFSAYKAPGPIHASEIILEDSLVKDQPLKHICQKLSQKIISIL